MNIEAFFKNSSDEKIQEFIKTVDMDSFCKTIDRYPEFVKRRIFDNVTDRVKIHIEEKIRQSKKESSK
jgi:hypothetical protein